MTDLLNVVERSKDSPLLIEEFLAREQIGDEGDDPTAPPAAGGAALAQPAGPPPSRAAMCRARGERLAQLDDVGAHVVDRRAAVLQAARVELRLLGAAAVAGRDLPDRGPVAGADGLRQLRVLEQRARLVL